MIFEMAEAVKRMWTLVDIPDQSGRLAVVTGATGGLGIETAQGLAEAGADVVLTGRNREKGRTAIDRIKRAVPGATVRFEMLDLASLKSVRGFAEKMLAQGKPLHLLINNAGVMAYKERRLTEDGFEAQFGTNHLGHFALTGLLLPLLKKAPGSKALGARVVNVSSLAHRGGKIDFDNLQAERRYKAWPAYQQSKLANLLFTFELQRRSDAQSWGLMVNAAHPGYARTDLIPNGPGSGGLQGLLGKVMAPVLSHSALDGALPTLFAATSAEAKALGYYGPDGFYELKGPVAPAFVAAKAKDEVVARRLWEVSERLTGVAW
jgi:NAD(P)-dependent dehydrogenase (short-subunit alcohol dehydrogenase family)